MEPTEREIKSREQRLRRAAKRQGLTLQKSRVRDERAPTWGRYFLVKELNNSGHWRSRVLVSPEYGFDLVEVEAYLSGDTDPHSTATKNTAHRRAAAPCPA